MLTHDSGSQIVHLSKAACSNGRLKYRSSIIVYFEILAVLAEGSIGPTKLSRKVNLSYDRLPPYLDKLVAKGAVRRGTRDGREEYTLTPMGADLLATLQKALDILEP